MLARCRPRASGQDAAGSGLAWPETSWDTRSGIIRRSVAARRSWGILGPFLGIGPPRRVERPSRPPHPGRSGAARGCFESGGRAGCWVMARRGRAWSSVAGSSGPRPGSRQRSRRPTPSPPPPRDQPRKMHPPPGSGVLPLHDRSRRQKRFRAYRDASRTPFVRPGQEKPIPRRLPRASGE